MRQTNKLSIAHLFCGIALATLCGGSTAAAQQAPSNDATDPLARITFDIKYMASDEMGGRQPGTPGIQLCEDYIVAEYKKAGLKPLENGTYFQELKVGDTRSVDADKTSLTLAGPDGTEIKFEDGKNYRQLIARRNFDLDSELVFVGYGITADEHNYDDYASVDVEGKVVVMIRYEPQSADPNSVFDGEDTSRHAPIRTKITAARRAGAAGILMVNDALNADEADELLDADRFGSNSLPLAQIKRAELDRVLAASPLVAPTGDKLKSVAAIEQLIDSNLEPLSQPIKGWSANYQGTFKREQVATNNIIGIIEGEGPNADETIVIGAHYDHLGMGAYGSRAGGRREIHNGADDNATGTAAILELARRINARDKKPGRRLVFICFTAEEMGLLGAIHYVNNPIYPLEKTVAMVNFDMIGWLREDRLTLFNWNSSPQLDAIFDAANEGLGLELVKPASQFAGSDHLPFNNNRVPNVFIHTGLNDVYHTPEDDFEAINCEGALKVIDYSEKVVDGLAALAERPKFGTPKPFRLGVMIDDTDDVVTIVGVTEGSIAEKAGLKEGDKIISIDGKPVTKRRDINLVVRRDKGKTVKMALKRGDAEVNLNVELKEDE